MLLWVNVHGGFLMGFLLLGIYVLPNLLNFLRSRNPGQRDVSGKRLKRLAVVGLLSALASFINPYGYKLHVHVYQYLSNRFLMDHINEFQSPNFHGMAQQCFLLLCLVAIAALAARRGKPRLVELLTALFAIASGLYASRNLPTSAILLTLVIVPLLSNRSSERSDAEPELEPEKNSYFQSLALRMETLEKQLRGHLLPLLIVLMGLWVCSFGGRLGSQQLMAASFSDKNFPARAVDILQQRQISDPIFAPDDWGGYLIYRFNGSRRVYFDGRSDFYGADYMKSYLKLIEVRPGWEQLLDEARFTHALLPNRYSLIPALQHLGWKKLYSDNAATLLEKP